MPAVLTLNAGSSSLKAEVFGPGGARLWRGAVSEIGAAARLSSDEDDAPVAAPDHAAALSAVMTAAGARLDGIEAAAHRIVHGGPGLTESTRLTPAVRAAVEAAAALAPLHNPPALAVIDALSALRPALPQVACFDTAFHATMPELARRYALPDRPETAGLRRYGFHGLSYASLVADLAGRLGRPLPRRLLACHLGNGASLCAIDGGRSVATTMGYSPLGGLTMGTRCGDIDGNAVLEIAARSDIATASRILNRESGLKGLAGDSDMRALEAAGTPAADFAMRHFIYWAVRQAGAMVAAMGGCDAIAFTGGIGENAPAIRAGIMDGLAYLGLAYDPGANAAGATRLDRAGSALIACIHPADEEGWIAREAAAVLSPG